LHHNRSRDVVINAQYCDYGKIKVFIRRRVHSATGNVHVNVNGHVNVNERNLSGQKSREKSKEAQHVHVLILVSHHRKVA